MKRHEKPIVVKVGSAAAKIYQGKSRGYDLFTVSYYLNGARRRETFGKLADARARALEVATQIQRGRAEMLTLNNSDRDSYITALERLRPLGIPLHAAIDELVTAREQLSGESLLDVVREHNARRRKVTEKSVIAVVDEMVEAKRRDGLSERHIRTLSNHLGRFANAFSTNIGSVTAKLIEDWLAHQDVGARTRNNIRTSVIILFRFAQARDYLAKGQLTEADYVARAKDRGGKIGVFTPKQMAELMAHAPADHALFYALGGFAGLRRAEIERLEWEDVNFARSFIEVGKHKAKTATRRLVPILPNLMRWLAPHRGAKGKLFASTDDLTRAINFAKGRGIVWPNNALRHSYATYRLAATVDAARVALEMGNSVAKLMANYRELADEHEAKAWFAISPSRPRNVVALRAG